MADFRFGLTNTGMSASWRSDGGNCCELGSVPLARCAISMIRPGNALRHRNKNLLNWEI